MSHATGVHSRTEIRSAVTRAHTHSREKNYHRFVIFLTFFQNFVLCTSVILISFEIGAKILPIIFLLFVEYFFSIRSQSPTFFYTLRLFKLRVLAVWCFATLCVTYLANTSSLKPFFALQSVRYLWGDELLNNHYGVKRAALALFYYALINMKLNYVRQILSMVELRGHENSENDFKQQLRISKEWYFKLMRRAVKLIYLFAHRLIQLALIFWGLSRISLIMFSFVLLGTMGMLSSNKKYNNALIQIAIFIAFFYLILQTAYNFTFIDYYFKSLGDSADNICFVIGFYKYYNLYKGKLLKMELSVEEVQRRRMSGQLHDMVGFILLYFMFMSLKEVNEYHREGLLRTLKIDSLLERDAPGRPKKFISRLLEFSSNTAYEIFKKVSIFVFVIIAIYKIDLLHFSYLLFYIFIILLADEKTIDRFHFVFLLIFCFLLTLIYIYHVFDIQLPESLEVLIGLVRTDNMLLMMYKEHFCVIIICNLSLKIEKQTSSLANLDEAYITQLATPRNPFLERFDFLIVFCFNFTMLSLQSMNFFTFLYLLFSVVIGALHVFGVQKYRHRRWIRAFAFFIFALTNLLLLSMYFFNLQIDTLQNSRNLIRRYFDLGTGEKTRLKQAIFVYCIYLWYLAAYCEQLARLVPTTPAPPRFYPRSLTYRLYWLQLFVLVLVKRYAYYFFYIAIFMVGIEVMNTLTLIYFLIFFVVTIKPQKRLLIRLWMPFYVFTIVQVLLIASITAWNMNEFNEAASIIGIIGSKKITTISLIIILSSFLLGYQNLEWQFFEGNELNAEKFNDAFRSLEYFPNVLDHYNAYLGQSIVSISPESIDWIRAHEPIIQLYLREYPKVAIITFLEKFENFVAFFVFDIALTMVLFTALYQANLYALFISFFTIIFSRFSDLALGGREGTRGARIIRAVLRGFLLFYAVLFINQLLLEIYYKDAWSLLIEEHVVSRLCPAELKNVFTSERRFAGSSDFDNCSREWKRWFLISDQSKEFLRIDALVLFVLTSAVIDLSKKVQRTGLSRRRRATALFTRPPQLKSMMFQLKFLVFKHFPNFSLILYFFTGMSLGFSDRAGDIVSIIYSFLAILFIISNYLMSIDKRQKVWRLLEYFNILVLIGTLLYQLPVFPCPVLLNDRSFLSYAECRHVLASTSDIEFYQSLRRFSFSNVIYVLFFQSLGIEKIRQHDYFSFTKQFLMTLFFLCGIIQRHIWAHPISKKHVSVHLKEKERQNLQSAVFFVENFHIEKYWFYKKYTLNAQIFNRRSHLMDKRIKKWEALIFSRNYDHENLINSDPELHDHDRDDQLLFEAEDRALNWRQDEPILDIDKVFHIFKASKTREEAELKLLEEQTKLYLELRGYIYEMQENNLEAFRGLSLRHHSGDSQERIEGREVIDGIMKKSLRIQLAKQEAVKEQFRRRSSFLILNTLVLRIRHYYIKSRHFLIGLLKRGIDSIDLKYFYLTDYENRNNLKVILARFICSISDKIVLLVSIINVIKNGNITSATIPVLIFVYGLVSYPFAPKHFWNLCIYYKFMLIIVKMIYQLPVFCSTSFYTFSFLDSCASDEIDPLILYQRIDFLVGIRKFYGESSFPKNQGIILGLIWDFILLLTLIFHKNCLKSKGIWDYVSLDENGSVSPQLDLAGISNTFHIKRQIKEKSQPNLTASPQSQTSQEESDEDSLISCHSLRAKVENKPAEKAASRLLNLFHRNFPYYMRQDKLVDHPNPRNPISKLRNEPMFQKPGRNYYNILFFLEAMIFFYFLLFYEVLIGSSTTFKDGIVKNRFSGDMVVVVMKILMLILVNRICFLKKYNVLRHVGPSQDSLVALDRVVKPDSVISKNILLVKYFIQIILVIFIHYFLFVTVPLKNKNLMTSLRPALVCYLIFYLYFAISALQIRSGYSDQIHHSPYTQEINFLENLSKRIVKSVPFIFEIKNVIDWSVTKTSLHLFQWFKLEDAYVILHFVKYEMNRRKQQRRPIDAFSKITYGWLVLLFLLFIIIFPIIFFSSLNPNTIVNRPYRISTELSVWTMHNGNKKTF